jgi:hypothetical protein
MARLSMDRRARSNSRGQILPLFALVLTAMLLMSSLLLDGASALLLKREYQSAADAAALAGASASGFQDNGCTLSLGSATTAAQASVHANLPKYDLTKVVVTCPEDPIYEDIAVQVSLSGTSPGFFSQVAGISSFAVRTSATAINGPITPGKYSVELLDPTGCASANFAGNVSAIFHGALFVNSNCSSTTKGALDSSGGSGSISFVGDAKAIVVGTVTGPKIDSSLIQKGAPGGDPLSLTPPDLTKLVTDPPQTNCPGGDKIYSPGIYSHGIQLGSKERAFLLPGIYYLNNTSSAGGIQVPAQAQLYSVNTGFDTGSCKAWPSSTDPTTMKADWATRCTAGQCGVLIVNNPANAKGDINVQAGGATFLLPYVPGVAAYKNLLIWQLKSASYQAVISLQGGSAASLTGGVYAPTATVSMGGNGASTASGDLTIQFICWDLSLNGNPYFNFLYNSDAFPKAQGYGLVQ